jgi:hypothetical protein
MHQPLEEQPVLLPQRQIEAPRLRKSATCAGSEAAMSPSAVSTGSPGTVLAIRKMTRVASSTMATETARRETT